MIDKMIKETKVTCKKCKANFILATDSSILDEVLDARHYICFTCEDKMEEEKMMTEIGIKFEKEQKHYEKLWKTKETEVANVESTKHEHYLVTIRDNNYQKEYTVRLSDLESVKEKIDYCKLMCEEVLKVELITITETSREVEGLL